MIVLDRLGMPHLRVRRPGFGRPGVRSLGMRAVRATLPPRWRGWLRSQQVRFRLQRHRAGTLDFGGLHRTTPVSDLFGFDRGTPVDRHYIEAFLAEHAADIRGRVLEMGDRRYITQFGGERVTHSDVLDVVEGNSEATIVADLTAADGIPSDQFDAIICTQTLQMIYELRPALEHLHRILKPGGVLLMTTGAITKIARREGRDDWGEYWHFTTQAAERLVGEAFAGGEVAVRSYGNVLAATAFLHGIAAEELAPDELAVDDPDFEVIVAARAVKARRQEA